jgi:hypothetical protein
MITKVSTNYLHTLLDKGRMYGDWVLLDTPIILYPKPYNELVKGRGVNSKGYVETTTGTTYYMERAYREGRGVEITEVHISTLLVIGEDHRWETSTFTLPTYLGIPKDFK